MDFEQSESGAALINSILKDITNPASKQALKDLKEQLKLLNKKVKMMKKDENLAIQYADRVAFDTIQGVFQAFHLWIISTDDSLNEIPEAVMTWLRTYENTYELAERIQARANARADFMGAK